MAATLDRPAGIALHADDPPQHFAMCPAAGKMRSSATSRFTRARTNPRAKPGNWDSSAGRANAGFCVSINADFDRPEVCRYRVHLSSSSAQRNNFLDWPQPAQSLITAPTASPPLAINKFTARDLSFATFSCVAACSHIFHSSRARPDFRAGLIASAMQLTHHRRFRERAWR